MSHYESVTKPALRAVREAFAAEADLAAQRAAVRRAVEAGATPHDLTTVVGTRAWNAFVRAVRGAP